MRLLTSWHHVCREGLYVGQNSMQFPGANGSILGAIQQLTHTPAPQPAPPPRPMTSPMPRPEFAARWAVWCTMGECAVSGRGCNGSNPVFQNPSVTGVIRGCPKAPDLPDGPGDSTGPLKFPSGRRVRRVELGFFWGKLCHPCFCPMPARPICCGSSPEGWAWAVGILDEGFLGP